MSDSQSIVDKYGEQHVVAPPTLSKAEMCLTTVAVRDEAGEEAFVSCAYASGHRSEHSWAFERGAKSSLNPHRASTRDFAAPPGSGRTRTVSDPTLNMGDVVPARTPRSVKRMAEGTCARVGISKSTGEPLACSRSDEHNGLCSWSALGDDTVRPLHPKRTNRKPKG
jgi:hypothetical protein